MSISNEELSRLLSYDVKSGIFNWKIKMSNYRGQPGDVAGSIQMDGYVHIMISGKAYKAHRLAWQYYYGEFPDGEIDHINGERGDNRISNLRVCTRAQNGANLRTPKNNSSGYKGVCWNKRAGKWRARISQNDKRKFLGYYDSAEIAAIVYDITALELFGKFAKTNF